MFRDMRGEASPPNPGLRTPSATNRTRGGGFGSSGSSVASNDSRSPRNVRRRPPQMLQILHTPELLHLYEEQLK